MLIPKLLPTPFADEGRKNTIPQVKPVDAGAHLASFELGFPPITMQPLADGGLPPDGMDVNGILYETTSHISYLNKGGQYKFNEEYSNSIGGYPKGAILLSDDENYQYISLIDSNKDNFNEEISENWSVISMANIDQLLEDKVSSTTMAQALSLKLDKNVYATLIQKGITQLTSVIDDSEDKAITPRAVNTIIGILNKTFSIDQTYQDVTTQRIAGTTYTNNTSKPIFVNVCTNAANMSSSGIAFYVNDKIVDSKSITGYPEWGGGAMRFSVLAFVMPGQAYKVDVNDTVIGLWMEYR